MRERPLLSEEILKKVQRIELATRKAVDDVMSGNYRSQFKGQGMQFSEHRTYVAGDDIRRIDWKVTARTRDPMVKKYEEERELTVLLIVDVSASKAFGTTARLKAEAAAEIAGMLSFAAMRTGDKVGALLFGGVVELILPPKKGKQHGLRIIREVLTHESRSQGTDLAGALESAARVMKHRGVVFILSDFVAEGYELALKRLARRNDVIAIQVCDERERAVPELGHLLLVDPETGAEAYVDTGSYAFRKWHEEFVRSHDAALQAAIKGSQAEMLRVMTQENYTEAVVRFFQKRATRRRR